MNRTWKVAMDLLDAGGIQRDHAITAADVARSAPTGPWTERPGYIGLGPDQAVRRIIEELARAKSLADQLASRLGRAAAPAPRRLP